MSAAAVGAVCTAAAVAALGLLPRSRAWRVPTGGHPDRDALADAGWRRPLWQWEAGRAAAAGIGAAVGWLIGAPLPAPVLFALAPSVLVRARAGAARDRAGQALVPMLAATHAALRSGVSLPEALRRAVAGCGDEIARRPFAAALSRFDLGDPLDAALRASAGRARNGRVSDAMETLALGVSQRLPTDRTAALLGAVLERARFDEGLEDEVRARSAGIRTQLYILSGVVPTLAAYLIATMPGLAATLSGTLGRTVLIPGAAALEVAGIVLSRRIVRSVLRGVR